MREFAKLYITKKAEHSAKLGHPWVFGEEVIRIEGEYSNGDLVDVMNDKAKYIGTGFVNDNSKIRVRIISRNTNDQFDRSFFARRIRYALEYRLTVMGEDNFKCCRLIFGEADQFPGLTVDRFNDILVAQVLCLGIDQRKTMIFELLVEILTEMGQTIHGIYERNDVGIRQLEGLEEYKAPVQLQGLGECPTETTIEENGILFKVDIVNGQKTGFFLDQKFNRLAIRRISKGRRVLDCFTHTGAFALNAAAAGAASVTAVDISKEAIDVTRENIALNGFEDKIETLQANVFDLLTEMVDKKERKYDLIILDPPAFTKSSHTVKNALNGYKEINYKAMKLLPRGGYLATCSCSHFMPEGLFIHMLKEAAFDADVSLRQVEARQQAPDHPILYNVPETNYLKFYVFQVV
ncbi:MAG: class I SAM-dependent rRNA methyltransferase [Acidaminococcaceae bacterium]|jgi:23S rRNA (cytosine1962-C5)-methyltransferase|nr:class I SAM-dependent rRNA methyltransferase [Acidaminococcaceae bacterium]MCI2110280.1 class I SAM-dependent rRNA methyltransferase [Acidaminococcaceae bacterium]